MFLNFQKKVKIVNYKHRYVFGKSGWQQLYFIQHKEQERGGVSGKRQMSEVNRERLPNIYR